MIKKIRTHPIEEAVGEVDAWADESMHHSRNGEWWEWVPDCTNLTQLEVAQLTQLCNVVLRGAFLVKCEAKINLIMEASSARERNWLESWCMSRLPFLVPNHMNCVFPVLSERWFENFQAWIESIACRTLVVSSALGWWMFCIIIRIYILFLCQISLFWSRASS